MFGFRGFGRIAKREASVPAAGREPMILVTREDIYRPASGANRETGPVLLLKKGHALEPEDLPRYIKNGARPSQFQLQYADETHEQAMHPPEFQRRIPEPAMANPILDPDTLVRMARARKRVLVLEPDPKSMKRLIDCFFVCGFNLERIHPVRATGHLDWALEKYQPDILVIDYHLQRGGETGLSILESLHSSTANERMILTIGPRPNLSEFEAKRIERLCDESEIAVLPKPINRFMLSHVLNDMQMDGL
jgi:hypothetical protein